MARKMSEPADTITPEKFREFYAEIRKAEAKKDSAVAECRLAVKRAKSGGVDLAALGLMRQLAKLEPDDAEIRIRNLRKYMAWDGSGVQLALFGDEPDAGDAMPSRDVVDAIHDEAVAVALEREAAEAADSRPVAVPPAVRKANTRRAMAEPAH